MSNIFHEAFAAVIYLFELRKSLSSKIFPVHMGCKETVWIWN